MTPPRGSWAEPAVTRGEVDRAGAVLARNGGVGGPGDPLIIGRALDVLGHWRALHGFPLNTFQVTLRNRTRTALEVVERIAAPPTASSIDEPVTVAQRLKRTPSIIHKLRRLPTMKLSQMQDIGGARAVLPTVAHVEAVRNAYRRSRMKHCLVREKNYLQEPKASGYRGIHLIYRYRSDRKPQYDGLQIEVQLRTRRQHAWATAVETVGTWLGQALKSSEGREDWREFFTLVGAGFARVEDLPPGSGVPEDPRALTNAIREAADRLQVVETLLAFRAALQVTEQRSKRDGGYFLLELQPQPIKIDPPDLGVQGSALALTIRAYRHDQLTEATRDYLDAEKALASTAGNAVLVRAASLEALRRAFPNYYLDTAMFAGFLAEIDRLVR